MSELTDRLAFKREMPGHLRELSLLLGRAVEKDELLSLEETRQVQARSREVARHPVSKFEIPFEEKREPRFAAFLQQLADSNSSDVYLWTPRSNMCGVLRPIPLRMVRMGFPFDVNEDGIIAVLTADLSEKLLLDYSTGDDGEELLEVEMSGERWGGITY